MEKPKLNLLGKIIWAIVNVIIKIIKRRKKRKK